MAASEHEGSVDAAPIVSLRYSRSATQASIRPSSIRRRFWKCCRGRNAGSCEQGELQMHNVPIAVARHTESAHRQCASKLQSAAPK